MAKPKKTSLPSVLMKMNIQKFYHIWKQFPNVSAEKPKSDFLGAAKIIQLNLPFRRNYRILPYKSVHIQFNKTFQKNNVSLI